MSTKFQDGDHFDAIIIGAGMSGLAAGIRLALFDKNVLILERHNVIGGLNSFYSFDGRKYDVGLHAMTNFSRPGTKGSPLGFLLRQLRLKRDDLDLAEQNFSRIAFPDTNLKFGNDLELLESEVARDFPNEIDNFRTLCQLVDTEFANVPKEKEDIPSNDIVSDIIKDPFLRNMLLLPVMAYGSSQENDLDWIQYTNLFKSLYLEGFCRPFDGVRVILRALQKKYKELGGIRQMKCGIKRIITKNNRAAALELDNGLTLSADTILSSIGRVETARLCDDQPEDADQKLVGNISFTETISVYDKQPREFGWDDTIIFYNDSDRTNFACPENLVDECCGVICFPNNYQYSDNRELSEGFMRISTLANYDNWNALPDAQYKAEKEKYFKRLNKLALKFLPKVDKAELNKHLIAEDMFTPRTIRHYTGHIRGTVYGAKKKSRNATTHLDNLYICGTDHGMLGITGAMISGITVANNCVLMGQPA